MVLPKKRAISGISLDPNNISTTTRINTISPIPSNIKIYLEGKFTKNYEYFFDTSKKKAIRR
jgi:hypothetical protein